MRTKEEIESLLGRPLDASVIETRKGGRGTTLEYVPGWYAIAKANEIFGCDGWERETTKMDFFQQEDKVKAVAKARVTVWFVSEDGPRRKIIREGTGGGSGWNADDYEDAAKEAEKDALKRALATFGQQFGLSLYQGNGETEIDFDWYTKQEKRQLRKKWGETDMPQEEAKEIFRKAEDNEWPLDKALLQFEEYKTEG